MKISFTALALAASALIAPLTGQAQTEIQWWHSMTAVNGEVVNDLAKNFNATQSNYKIVQCHAKNTLFYSPRQYFSQNRIPP